MRKEITGVFNGQVFIADEGGVYPVPANYASKSCLVEGDYLKLFIDTQGTMPLMYKQISKADRISVFGVVVPSEDGRLVVIRLDGGAEKKVLQASVTFHQLKIGDRVIVSIPARGGSWCAIESVIQ